MKNIATDIFHLEDIFEEGWRVFKTIFAKCAPIVLALAFLSECLALMAVDKVPALELAARAAAQAPPETIVDEQALAGKILLIASILFKAFFRYIIFSIALLSVMKYAERFITLRVVPAGDVLAESVRRWPRYLETTFLAGFIIVAWSLLVFAGLNLVFSLAGPHSPWTGNSNLQSFALLVPAIVWTVYFGFAPIAVAVTSLSGKAALNYSKSLVHGRFWRTLVYFLVIFATTFALIRILVFLTGGAAGKLAGIAPPILAKIAIPAIADAIASLPVILQLSLTTVFFLNTAYLKRGLKS